MMSKYCGLHKVAWVLVMIGALNWGLIGLSAKFNVVNVLLGGWPTVERIVYILVGVSALFMLTCGMCKGCKVGDGGMEKKM